MAKLYSKAIQARAVKAQAEINAVVSPKFNNVAAIDPNKMENSSHERNVRSAAKNTLGSTLIGT